jgi:hypothetical protein
MNNETYRVLTINGNYICNDEHYAFELLAKSIGSIKAGLPV